MAISLPDYGMHHPDRVVSVPGGRPVEIYHGKGKKQDHREHAIGLIHGWLGAQTMGFMAGELSEQGFDVFTIHNDKWRPDERERLVHTSTKAATEALVRPTVEYYIHSDAVRALLGSVLFQKARSSDDLAYEIAKITTISGNGTNGIPINLLQLPRELEGIAKLATNSPYRSVRTYGQSLLNLSRNPFSSTMQGLLALRYDAGEDIAKIEQAGVPVRTVFQDDDNVIVKPNNLDAESLPGAHMDCVIRRDNILDLAA